MRFLFVVLFNFIFCNHADWPMFGGNSAHTGYKNINILTNGDGAILLWTKTLETPITYATVSNNHYYTVSSNNLYILDASNGNQLGSVNIGPSNSIGAPIVAFNEQIITQMVGSNQGIYVNSYSLINTNYSNTWQATGSCQWPMFPYGATTSDTEQSIYFPGGRYNGVMYAVNSNGSQLFSAVIPSHFGCDYWTPTVYKGRVFMNSQPGEGISGYFAEIDNKTGSVLWKLDLDSSWDGYSTYWVPSITNNVAIVHSRISNIMIVNVVHLTTHEIIWNYTCTKPDKFTGSFKDYTASTDGMNVFVACSDGIKSLDLMTGKVIIDYICNICGGQPIVTNDTVIINSDDGVKIFVKDTGELIDTLDATGMIALSDNKLFVTNNIYATITAYLLNLSLPETTRYPSFSPTPLPSSSSPTSDDNDNKNIPFTTDTTKNAKITTNSPSTTTTNMSPIQDSSSSNGNNTGMIVAILVVCIIIFIAGILMGYCLLKYKMKNELNYNAKSVMNSNSNRSEITQNYVELKDFDEGMTENHIVTKQSIAEGETFNYTYT